MNSARRLLVVGLLGGLGALQAADPVLPQRRPADRYARMADDAPFALATPAAPTAEATPGPLANFYITGVAQTDQGAEPFVAIKSRNDNIAFSLFGSEPGYDGISIGNIVWSNETGKSKVTLRKGAESATLEFDPQTIQAPIAPTPQMGIPGMPGGNPKAPRTTMPRPPGAVPMPMPSQGAQQIPRPSSGGVMLPQPVPGGPGASSSSGPGESRQRVRVIRSSP